MILRDRIVRHALRGREYVAFGPNPGDATTSFLVTKLTRCAKTFRSAAGKSDGETLE